MCRFVTLRKSGNDLIFTVPDDFRVEAGCQYMVSRQSDGSVIYQPSDKQNVFDNSEWLNYDYQKDLKEDPELHPLF